MNARPAPVPSQSSPLPRPARRRSGPRPLWLGIPLLGALLFGAGVLGLALGACSPTQGEDGVFDPQPTTNADFTLPATPVTVGNQPITMDYTTTLGVLDLVAVVNHVAAPPLDADGKFIPAGSVSILRNFPLGTITEVTRLDTLQFPSLALWADLDGDGTKTDLVVLDNINEHVAVYTSTGPGTFAPAPQEFTFTDTVAQMEIVSLDGVGGDDVVLTLPAGDLIVALVNTAGTLAETPTTAVTGLGRFVARKLNVADNTVDLAVLRTGSNTLEIYNGVGDGTFDQTLPSISIAVDNSTIDLVAGDLTGAGNVDLALLGDAANSDHTYVRLYTNGAGAGEFTLTSTTTLPIKGYRIFLADTGLGTGQDVAVVHRNDRILSFLGANGSGFDATQLTTTRDPIDVVAGDIDMDGNVDLVTAEDDRRTIGVFHGDGAGGFTRSQIGLTTHVVFPRLLDVDSDTDLDLIILEPYSDQLAVFDNLAL